MDTVKPLIPLQAQAGGLSTRRGRVWGGWAKLSEALQGGLPGIGRFMDTPKSVTTQMAECRLCLSRSFVIHKSASVATLAAHWNQLDRF